MLSLRPLAGKINGFTHGVSPRERMTEGQSFTGRAVDRLEVGATAVRSPISSEIDKPSPFTPTL